MKEPLIYEEKNNDVLTFTFPKALSPPGIVKYILKNAGVMLTSYSYSFFLLLVSYLIGQLKDENGDNTLYLAGGTLSISVLDTCVVVSVSAGFILGFVAKGSYLEIKSLKESPVNSENLDSKIDQFSTLPKNGMKVAAPFIAVSSSIMLLNKYILEGIGQDPAVVDLIQWPLMLGGISLPIYALRFCNEKILLGSNKLGFVAVVSLANLAIFGGGLSYGLGLGKWGLPKLDILGIYIGMFAENLATYLACMGGMHFMKDFKDIPFLKNFFNCTGKEQYKFLNKISVPVILTLLSEWFVTLVRSIQAGNLGNNEQAAQIFATQLCFFIFLNAMALSEAVGLGINEVPNIVNKEKKNLTTDEETVVIRRGQTAYLKGGLILSTLINGAICAITVAKPDILTDLLNPYASAEVSDLGDKIIPYVAANALLYNVAIILRQGLLAKTGSWPSLDFNASIWAGVLSSYLLAFPGEQGIDGINQGALIGTFLGTLTLVRSFWNGDFNKSATEHSTPIVVSIKRKVASVINPIADFISTRASSLFGSTRNTSVNQQAQETQYNLIT